jgi:thiamine pyrophosphokinase
MGLLEWSPLGWQWNVMKLDIKVDVLLGDFDGDFDPSYYKENNIH